MNNDLLQQLQQSHSDIQTTWIVTNAMLQTLQPEVAEAVLAAAVPHWFNQPILAALLAANFDQAELFYQMIQQLSFTERFGQLGYALHERTRTAILTHLTTVLPEQFRRYSQSAHTYFNAIHDLQHQVEATYHLLAIDETQGLAQFKTQMQQYRDHGDFSAANNLLRNAQELTELKLFVEETEAEIDRHRYLMAWKHVQLGQSETETSNAKMHLKQAIRVFQPKVDPADYDFLNLAKLRASANQLQQDFLTQKLEEAVRLGKPSYQKVWFSELVDLERNQTDYESALQHCNDALRLHPDDSTFIVQRGEIHRLMKRYEEALADYTHALELNPTLARAYTNRGTIYADLGQHEAALADFTHALTLKPSDAKAYHNRGLTYAALQQAAAALTDFNEAAALDLKDAYIYYNRGLTYHALKQQQAALTDFSHAIELDPTLADAYANRGVIYAALQQRQAAMADYNRAIALNPGFAIAYNNRGNLHRALQQYQTALADFNQAIALDPNDATAYTNRGTTYAELGRREDALADFNQAIQLDPNFAKAYYNRGSLYDDLDQRDAALADLNQAIHLDPNDTSAYLNIGVLFGNQGQLVEALPYFEKAAQLGSRQAAQYITQVRQRLGLAPAPATDPTQASFAAFQQANSLTMMQQATARFPLLLQADFMAAIEAWIEQQAPPEERPALAQRLGWLRQLTRA